MGPRAVLERYERVAALKITNPPINALSSANVNALIAALDAFERDAEAEALLVYRDERTFVAGGDISEFDRPDFSAAPFNAFQATFTLEDPLKKPSCPVRRAVILNPLKGLSDPEFVSVSPLAIEPFLELDLSDRPGRVQVDARTPRGPDAARRRTSAKSSKSVGSIERT